TGGDSNGITSIFTRASEQGLKTWSGNSYYSGLVAGAHFQIFTPLRPLNGIGCPMRSKTVFLRNVNQITIFLSDHKKS
ncbi:MAG: hypothetical protein ACPHFU_03325, partial [Paracoccaceae bacterium]